ncbi:uncharacterized protein BDW43DRAFT_219433 [Aspergillus alliaceus]|uniref:uncharacterized protein n=1 Tax=Petromyces alliaceus TaxID=209559 RepID=UPI0012A528E9|nr:uncharacterized protein BDW43DRAFT_219433 [Aspergillus alliaceus]KAB8228389.1 hypothetical protein BDW43DRAFT_219433 [Aspergillus alliaceus]
MRDKYSAFSFIVAFMLFIAHVFFFSTSPLTHFPTARMTHDNTTLNSDLTTIMSKINQLPLSHTLRNTTRCLSILLSSHLYIRPVCITSVLGSRHV